MSRNILIRENGSQRVISNVEKIRTELENNTCCNWIPERAISQITYNVNGGDKNE